MFRVRNSLRVASTAQHMLKRDVSFLSRLNTQLFGGRFLQVPKGFEKYLPKKGGSTGTSSTASGAAKESAAKESAKKAVGGQGKGPDPNNPFSWGSKGTGGSNNKGQDDMTRNIVIAAVGLAGLGLSVAMSSEPKKEISWVEFESTILPSGTVERIDVINKSYAKIIRKPNAPKPDPTEAPPPDWADHDAHRESSSKPFGSHGDDPSQQHGAASKDAIVNTPFIKITRRVPPEIIKIGSVESFERKLDAAQNELRIAPAQRVPVFFVEEINWGAHLLDFLPMILILGGLFAIIQMGPGGQLGKASQLLKSRATKVDKSKMKVTFKDVAGCDEAKKEIMEFVEFLKDHKKFTDLGAKIPKGALLVGPPGTGKTLLAKATAGEADVPFFSVSGSDFQEMFVGVGAGRVRDLFADARENAPCIIFIDEIDAVGGKRGRSAMGNNSERENTLNQLLVEMDGFTGRENIVVLAGTNRADVLDPALLRPGRFDRQVQVDKPDIKGRKEIFEVYLKSLKLADEISQLSPRLAALTPGFSGADIANICNEAAIVAARKNKTAVEAVDFESATDRVIAGMESHKLISPEEKRIVAYHEAGHAVAGWFLEFADPLLKVTIIPRSGGSLGFAQYLPKELFLRTKEQILDIVCMALAGRAAEQVNFGRVTSGAADDLRRVTQICYQMVSVYGMNSRVGQVSFPKEGGEWPQDRLYSETTAEMIDEEVRELVELAYSRSIAMMEEKKEQVRLIAELLLKQETITHSDVANLIGDRPFSAGKEYDEYVTHMKKGKHVSNGTDAADIEADAADKSDHSRKDTPGDETALNSVQDGLETAEKNDNSGKSMEESAKGDAGTNKIVNGITRLVGLSRVSESYE